MKAFIQSTDTELVKLFQNGNNQALEVLLNRHKDKIFTGIKLLVKDTYLAEDIFQKVFIKIINTLRANGYKEEGKFLPWANRIAHNMCLDHLRKVQRAPSIKTSDDHDIFEVLNFVEDSADKGIIKNQSHKILRNMLDFIPAEQREVIVLRHYADLSFKEIAEMTNCSINTALGRMRYGLINLRQIIEEKQLAV
jgi:RNA polymerase sigma-70 factor (ECF subfamily)